MKITPGLAKLARSTELYVTSDGRLLAAPAALTAAHGQRPSRLTAPSAARARPAPARRSAPRTRRAASSEADRRANVEVSAALGREIAARDRARRARMRPGGVWRL